MVGNTLVHQTLLVQITHFTGENTGPPEREFFVKVSIAVQIYCTPPRVFLLLPDIFPILLPGGEKNGEESTILQKHLKKVKQEKPGLVNPHSAPSDHIETDSITSKLTNLCIEYLPLSNPFFRHKKVSFNIIT